MSNDSTASTTKPDARSDFFKPGAISTMAGATVAVVVVKNTVYSVFGFSPDWFPLAVAILFSLVAYQVAMRKKDPELGATPRFARYVLVVLNGFVIYASAFGVQVSVLSEKLEFQETEDARAGSKEPRRRNAVVSDGWEPLFSRPPEPNRKRVFTQ